MAQTTNNRLENTAVTPDCSLREAMRAIEQNSLGTVFVVDDEYRLIGILTDGDIRGAILKNFNLGVSVRTLMNTSPTVVTESKSPDEIHAIMMRTSLNIIPLTTANGCLLDYYFLKEISELLVHSRAMTLKKEGGNTDKINTVLVIGGCGYIGSVLVRRLLDKRYDVIVLDSLLYGENSMTNLYSNPSFELIRGDVRNTEILMSAIQKADAVIHLGEIVGDPACALNSEFTVDVNFMATKNITDICLIYGIRRLIFASSCSVYGAGDGILSEESALNPVSLYAKCKIESEKIILSQSYKDFYPTILRFATVFGPSYRPRFDLVVNMLTIKAMLEGKITLLGGKQWRPFISVDDVARAIITVLKAPEEKVGGKIFNTGDDRLNYRIEELGMLIKEIFHDVEVILQDKNEDNRSYHVSFTKINNLLDFECKTDLKQGIKDLITMIKNQNISDYKQKYYHNFLTLGG